MSTTEKELASLDLPLQRDVFLRDLLRNLSGTLQEVVGLDEASGFISVVGQKMGEQLNHDYRAALQVSQLSRDQVSAVLVDLKQRINGNFSIVSEDDEKIVLQTTSCPFEEKVLGRESLCMMTSNVFGTITAENLGYAKVHLKETIASGNQGCKVVVYLNENDESMMSEGNEYFQG